MLENAKKKTDYIRKYMHAGSPYASDANDLC